jgi:hypothetical protein
MRYRHRQKNHGDFGGSVSQRARFARSQATRVVPVERRFMIRRADHNLALSRNVVLLQRGRRKRSVATGLYRRPPRQDRPRVPEVSHNASDSDAAEGTQGLRRIASRSWLNQVSVGYDLNMVLLMLCPAPRLG